MEKPENRQSQSGSDALMPEKKLNDDSIMVVDDGNHTFLPQSFPVLKLGISYRRVISIAWATAAAIRQKRKPGQTGGRHSRGWRFYYDLHGNTHCNSRNGQAQRMREVYRLAYRHYLAMTARC